MSNPIVHAEIIGANPEGLREFYAALFGWEAPAGDPVAATVSAPDSYAFNAPDGSSQPVPLGIGGGTGFAPRAVFYVGVEDVPASLARAVELGGSLVVDTTSRPDGAIRVAQFADPEGNIIGLAGPA